MFARDGLPDPTVRIRAPVLAITGEQDAEPMRSAHQREHAEAIVGAKKPETRQRRIASAVKMLAARRPKKAFAPA